MDLTPEVTAALIGIGPGSAALFIQGFTAFRRSNVDKFFEKLIETNLDLTVYGHDENLQRILFSIVEKVANEANQEKIERWKNATVRLATDFKDFSYKNNFIRTLDLLTVFDLTVLVAIYTLEFKNPAIENELIHYFETKAVPKEMTLQCVKSLASQNLISDNFDRTAVYGDGINPILQKNAIYKERSGAILYKIHFRKDNHSVM